MEFVTCAAVSWPQLLLGTRKVCPVFALYPTIQVTVTTASGEQHVAYVYVWADHCDPILLRTVEWDYEDWRELHMQNYLGMVRGVSKWIKLGKPDGFEFGSADWTITEEED